MNVCFIGKHKYPREVFSNEQDLKTWRSMAVYFDSLFVIAQSPDWLFHHVKERNIKVYLVPDILGYIGFIVGAIKLGFYLNLKYGIDVFDASEVAGGGTAATILKFLTGKPTVVEVQGEIFRKSEHRENLKSRALKKIGRWAMNRAARIRVISRATFNQVRDQGIGEEKICLVSLRVDLGLFSPRVKPHSGVTIGYLGRVVDGKGLEDLIKAISMIENRQSGNFKVLIFGNGPIESKLKRMAQKMKVENLIEWRGFAPYGRVPEALSEIDIFVYPSWHEGFGRSIMEAMAMEKPVVAADVGGIPDLVKNGKNGFLVKPHHPEALAEKIEALMNGRELRESFGKSGRKWVSENFEWSDGIKKFAQVFLELK